MALDTGFRSTLQILILPTACSTEPESGVVTRINVAVQGPLWLDVTGTLRYQVPRQESRLFDRGEFK